MPKKGLNLVRVLDHGVASGLNDQRSETKVRILMRFYEPAGAVIVRLRPSAVKSEDVRARAS